MTWYEFLLFVHISATVTWVGSGFVLIVLAVMAERAGDDDGLARILHDTEGLANRVFIPSGLIVVTAGILLVIDGPWTFDQLWIVLGLIGYASTFVTGLFILKPRADRISARVEREGGMSPTTLAETRRLLTLARIDYVTLFLVIAVMVTKPTGDDTALLIVLAAILITGVAWATARARAIQVPRESAAAEA